jgi:dipeptidyl aminopeptidase/acylaminoacyl peptidase
MKRTTYSAQVIACAVLLFVLAVLAQTAQAQGTVADYTRAQGLRERFEGLAVGVAGQAVWIQGTNRFWYARSVRGGREFMLVDADTLAKGPAFDHEKLAAALSAASGAKYTAVTLPFTEPRPAGRFRRAGPPQLPLTFTDEQRAIEFGAAGFRWKCSLTTYECTKGGPLSQGPDAAGRRPPVDESFAGGDDLLASPAVLEPEGHDGIAWFPPQHGLQQSPQQLGGPPGASAPEETARPSPDGNWEAVIENYNVHLQRKGKTETTALSYDGSEGNYYTLRSVAWSPDSKRLVAYRTRPGYQREVHFIESSPADQLQPKHSTIVYRKPGDELDHPRPVLFEIETKQAIPIDDTLFPNPYSLTPPVWWKDGRGFTFEYNQRGHQLYRVVEVDAQTGKAGALITEDGKTFVDYRPLAENRTDTGKKFRYDLADGKEIIWASERDGWEHLYLLDGATGRVKNQITRGPWIVRYVDYVDEAKRQIWFRSSGIRPGQDPYFTHYCRINFDGTGLVVFTEADGDHTVQFSEDRKYYVDTWSRVNQAPIMQLRRTEDAQVLLELEKGDISALVAAGWKAPEVFVAKGRDGSTDIWGVIYRPTTFDPRKKYPVIEAIYAGPQGSFVPKSFTGTANALAELGFIVVQIDGMGTNNRSKAFHEVAWRNLADAGFPDRILWHKAVAAKYPWYDVSRVGIHGNSAGGQNALGALLFHPEFYKVAVSNSGCHDNRMDKIWWNELWMSWPLGPHYEASSNMVNAHRLQGKLLLIVGELDTNVDPSSTLQVANQLIKHNKKFDLLFVPGGGHGAGGEYGQHRLQDFFVEHLLGVAPPDWSLLKPASPAPPREN